MGPMGHITEAVSAAGFWVLMCLLLVYGYRVVRMIFVAALLTRAMVEIGKEFPNRNKNTNPTERV